jgi:hypothetical protein
MSSLYKIVTVMVAVTLLGSVIGTSLQQQVFAKPDKPSDPCKAFKLLAEYVKQVGLHAVATGDDKEMSGLVDDFRHYANAILDVSPPDKGKC